MLEGARIVQSLSRPRQCWDNAVAESFFATLKTELVYRNAWPTRAAARNAVFEFIEVFYNRRRLHSSLGYRSPVEYESVRAMGGSPAYAA
jgi:putative transposase